MAYNSKLAFRMLWSAYTVYVVLLAKARCRETPGTLLMKAGFLTTACFTHTILCHLIIISASLRLPFRFVLLPVTIIIITTTTILLCTVLGSVQSFFTSLSCFVLTASL